MASDPKNHNDAPDKHVEVENAKKPKLTGERLVTAKEVKIAEQGKSNGRLKSAADLLSIKPGETIEQYQARVNAAGKEQAKNPLTLYDSKTGVVHTADGATQTKGQTPVRNDISEAPKYARSLSNTKGVESALPPAESVISGMATSKPHVDNRTVEQKAGDFFNAAMRRATNFFTDASQQQAYFSGIQEKVVGIGEGLNEAKEEVKKFATEGFFAALGAGDSALNAMSKDPRAAEKAIHELSNNIRATVTDMASQALNAMAHDPHAFDKLMNKAFEHLKDSSEKYSHMTPREQGRVIGKFMFAMVNPEGSLEAPQLAGQATMRGASAVEKHAPQIIASLEKLRAQSPQLAERAEQWLGQHMPGWKKTEDALRSASNKVEKPGPHNDKVKTVEKHDSGDVIPPKTFEQFVAEVQNEVRCLPKKELEFLEKPPNFGSKIEVVPVRRITDRFPHVDARTGGCYDPVSRKICIAQEVWSPGLRKFVPNDDVRFALQHEIGHAFNDNAALGGFLSSKVKAFRDAFEKDKAAILLKDAQTAKRIAAGSNEDAVGIWRKLGMEKKEASSIDEAMDEVFADMFAHSKGLTSKNPWSQMMKENFPECLKVMEQKGYLR